MVRDLDIGDIFVLDENNTDKLIYLGYVGSIDVGHSVKHFDCCFVFNYSSWKIERKDARMESIPFNVVGHADKDLCSHAIHYMLHSIVDGGFI